MTLKKNQLNYKKYNQKQGFTLIEVMLVIVVVGLMVSAVQLTSSSSKVEQLLEQNSTRFAGVFDIVTEYGMLNNLELGLHIEKDTYQFLAYNGVRWTPIPDNPIFEAYTLPEGVEMSLQLDDLPIEGNLLFDPSLLNIDDDDDYTKDDDDNISDKSKDHSGDREVEKDEEESEEVEKIIPQVYMLSGGDITPFSITFAMKEFLVEQDEDVIFKVSGVYSTPLTIEGPLPNDNSR